jgi:hypothetical protein
VSADVHGKPSAITGYLANSKKRARKYCPAELALCTWIETAQWSGIVRAETTAELDLCAWVDSCDS